MNTDATVNMVVFAKEEEVAGPPESGKATTVLLPVLRNYRAEDIYARTVVHRVLGADLAIFLGHAGPTPRGTMGIEYVMRNSVSGDKQETERLFESAWKNLAAGLQVNKSAREGTDVFTVSHTSNLAVSALGLPDFYAKVCSWLGREEVLVGFTDREHLFVLPADSSVASKLSQIVSRGGGGEDIVSPACYILNSKGLQRVTG